MADKAKPKGKVDQSKKDEEKEKLIEIAIKFLGNPDVANASDTTKRSFLKKKGLSDEEIDKAYSLKRERDDKAAAVALVQGSQNTKPQAVLPNTTMLAATLSPEDLAEKVSKAASSNIVILRNYNLGSVPSQVFTIETLQVLVVSFNPLAAIPDEIEKLVNLRVLHAASCKLQDNQISIKLWSMKSLKELNLSRNQLTNVDQVGQLTDLTILDLSYNSIFELPEDLGSLQQLKFLSLAHNNLSGLPNSIRQLDKLRKLFLQDNLIDVVDQSIFTTKEFDIVIDKNN